MSTVARLHEVVASGQLAKKIFANVEGIDLSDEVRDRLTAFAKRRTAGLGELTTTISPVSNADFYRALAAFWLELRFEWQRHNLVSNYHAIRTGGCHVASFMLAAAASSVLACIEQHLSDEDRALMDGFAAELISGTHLALAQRLDPPNATAEYAA